MYGRLNVNVALNRPTFMSSIWYDANYGGYFPSSLAVDGNNDPRSYRMDNSCVHTLAESNPWWAVDLGAALAVVGVLFSNRAEYWGNVISTLYSLHRISLYNRTHRINDNNRSNHAKHRRISTGKQVLTQC